MIYLGQFNTLKAYRKTSNGYYLCDEEELNEVLLPNKYVPRHLKIGGEIKVFIYKDSEDRLIATTLTPKILLHQFVLLQVKEVNRVGAFMDWGLEKDLMIPYAQQNRRMRRGNRYLVYLYLDEQTERLVGSCKLRHFLQQEPLTVKKGEKVNITIWEPTELGYNVIINNQHKGLIYKNEIFRKVRIGEQLEGFVKNIREDNKIDISLQRQGYGNITSNVNTILELLHQNKGFLALNDKSAPEDIYTQLKMSKKTFKRTIGALYRERKIRIEEDGVYLV